MILSSANFNRGGQSGHHHHQPGHHRKPPPQSPAPQQPNTSSTLSRLSRLGHNSHSIGPKQSSSLPAQSSIYAPPSSVSSNATTIQTHNQKQYQSSSSQYRVPNNNKVITSGKVVKEPSSSGRESALGGFFRGLNGTLRRRSKSKAKQGNSGQQECEDIYAEGLKAIDGNAKKPVVDYDTDKSALPEHETRTFIRPESLERPDYKNLERILINWINDELADQRIIVKELQDDLYDGQILGKLVEKLQGMKLDLIEVTQNETAQKHKLRTVLETINRILTTQARWAQIRWSVDGIHKKNLVEIIQLLVTLACYYRAPVRLPQNVRVMVDVKQRQGDNVITGTHEVQLTDNYDEFGAKVETRDAFDTLFDYAPEKLTIVRRSLSNFVNRHLSKINIHCSHGPGGEDLEPMQFSDGLLLIFLISSLEEYFVPFGNIFTQPTENLTDINSNTVISFKTALQPNNYINTQPIHKLHNVNVAFQLIEDAGINVSDKVRAEDIVNGDLKSTLRVLYLLFSRYKHL